MHGANTKTIQQYKYISADASVYSSEIQSDRKLKKNQAGVLVVKIIPSEYKLKRLHNAS